MQRDTSIFVSKKRKSEESENDCEINNSTETRDDTGHHIVMQEESSQLVSIDDSQRSNIYMDNANLFNEYNDDGSFLDEAEIQKIVEETFSSMFPEYSEDSGIVHDNISNNKKSDENIKRKKRGKVKKYKYENGNEVPSDMRILHQGRGSASRHYVVNPDGSTEQVFLPEAFRRRKLKRGSTINNSIVVDNPPISIREHQENIESGNFLDAPENLENNAANSNPIQEEDLNQLLINEVEESQVNPVKKYKYENGNDVLSNAIIIHKGRNHYVLNSDGSKEQVFTPQTFYRRRRGYMYEDGRKVPSDAIIQHTERDSRSRHYVLNPDGSKEQVFTYDALYQKYKDNVYQYEDGQGVSLDAIIEHEGKTHYVLNSDGSKEQVFTSQMIYKKSKGYLDESEQKVPPGVTIQHEGEGRSSRHYVLNPDNSRSQVFTKYAIYQKHQKGREVPLYFYEDGREVPLDATIEHKSKSHYVLNSNGSRDQVFTKKALYFKRRNNVYVYKDGREVASDAVIQHTGKGNRRLHYVLNSNWSKEEVFKAATLGNRKKRELNSQAVVNNAPTSNPLIDIIDSIDSQDELNQLAYFNSNNDSLDNSRAHEIASMENMLKQDFPHLFPEDPANDIVRVDSRQADDLNNQTEISVNTLSAVEDDDFYRTAFNSTSSPLLFGHLNQNTSQNLSVQHITNTKIGTTSLEEDEGVSPQVKS